MRRFNFLAGLLFVLTLSGLAISATSDINGDGIVNLRDFAEIGLYWQKQSAYYGNADINRDGNVNVYDLAELADNWLVSFQLPGLVGAWLFDNQTADDSSGNGHHGTFIGNGQLTFDDSRGYVLNLDGSGDYVNIAGNIGSFPGGTITISAWIKPDLTSSTRIVLEKSGVFSYKIVDGKQQFTTIGKGVHFSNSAVSAGTWQHIAVVFTASSNVKFYRNGSLVSQATATSLNTSTAYTRIGADSSGNYGFDGLIDDVQVFNYALSEQQINYLCNKFKFLVYGRISDPEHDMLDVTMSGLPNSPKTDADGFYCASVPYGWTGTITPNKPGYIFTPSSITLSNVTVDQNSPFDASIIMHTLSGHVATEQAVLFEGLPCSTSTDENGFYSCQVEYGWNGTVTPDKQGYIFNPAEKTYSNVTCDIASQDYSPYRVAAIDPSPADGAINVLENQILSWTPGTVADPVGGQAVYFGTDFDAVSSRDASVFKGFQNGTTYNPGTLQGLTTYYWAIDTINNQYPQSPWQGPIWSFTTINTELVGCWKLDEGSGNIATDTSGHGHNGTIIGASWVTDSQMGKVLDFEGIDYITIPSAALSTINSQITIALWQYGDTAIQPQQNSIFEGTKGGIRTLNAHIPWSSGGIYWDAGSSGTVYDRISKTAESANDYEGQWNHWAFTKNTATGIMNIYLNGQLWQSGSGKTKSMSGINAFKIGSIADGTSNYDGLISQVRLYNVELSASQITSLLGDNDATVPSPAHRAYNIDTYPTISWKASPKAAHTQGHDLYLGTNPDLVTNRDPSVFVGSLDANSYSPDIRLSTRYYWLVDEVNDLAPGSPWLCDELWYFTTRSSTQGYYKDLFIDGGAGLTSYKAEDIPSVGLLGYSNEHITSNNVNVTRKIMIDANSGSWDDDNGALLYPDNEPRFRMVYVNGGDSGAHKTNLEPEGTGIMQNFVFNGGSYTGSCAGAWLTGTKSFRWGLAKVVLSTTSTGSTYHDAFLPDGVTSYKGRVLPLSPFVAYYPDLFGDFKIHGLRQNGGCRCDVGTTGWNDLKAEALALYDFSWSLRYGEPNAVPVDLTIYGSDTQKATHKQCVIWGYKEDPEHGKLVPCGSHPEHLQNYGEETPLQASIFQYAFSFNGRATVKASLTSGVTRSMDDNAVAGHEKIGDMQYHHFTVEVPAGAAQLQIVLDGNLYDMNLYAKKGDFAFMSEPNVISAANTTAIDETLTINSPAAGTWYIGVKCNKKVAATNSGAYYSYTDRFELLNGIPYTIKATLQ